MSFHHKVLQNGLTIIGERRESAVSVAIGFFVRTGARDETPKMSGVSHFLEHMMFKGTATRTALDINFDLAAIGAQANAYTSEENTVYYLAVLPEYLRDAFDILSDMLRPALDPKEFDVEKKVILEEIALYQDRPTHLLFEASMREFFSGHPAGNSVLGTTQSITDLTQPEMQGYFSERYTASNIVLAVSGKFEWDDVIALAEERCAGWPSGAVGRARPAHLPVAGKRELTKEELNRAHLCLVAPGPSAQDEERYEAHVLTTILGDSSGSRCYWELIDKGLADAASVDLEEMDGVGMLYGYVSATPERLEEVKGVMERIMGTPLEFSDADLERAVTKLATRIVLQGESAMRRLMATGLEWIYRGRYRTVDEELQRIKQVNRRGIEALVAKYNPRPITEVRLIPA